MGTIALFFLRCLAWFYYFLPATARIRFGRAIGWMLEKLGIRAPVVRNNLKIAYPAEDRESRTLREALFHESYAHLGQLGLEILMLLGPMPRFVRQHSVLRGVEHWEKAREAGKGVIFLASHTGNWEVMVAAGAYWGGIDIMMVTKHLKPEWLHQAIERGRKACRVSATYEPKTMRDILAQLKRNGAVGIVLDQYAGPPVGVRVPFMGVHVSTTTALAMLVKRTGAVVLPVVNSRDPEGRFLVEIKPPLVWQQQQDDDANYELAANTALFVSELEKDIRKSPGQWLWIHRRFKGDLSPLKPGEWNQGRPRK